MFELGPDVKAKVTLELLYFDSEHKKDTNFSVSFQFDPYTGFGSQFLEQIFWPLEANEVLCSSRSVIQKK